MEDGTAGKDSFTLGLHGLANLLRQFPEVCSTRQGAPIAAGTTMITLQDRARALEDRFAHEEAAQFRAAARRNKLIGLWAGQLLGKPNPIAYAEEFAAWAVEHREDNELTARLRGEFAAAALVLDEQDLATRMQQMLLETLADMRAP